MPFTYGLDLQADLWMSFDVEMMRGQVIYLRTSQNWRGPLLSRVRPECLRGSREGGIEMQESHGTSNLTSSLGREVERYNSLHGFPSPIWEAAISKST